MSNPNATPNTAGLILLCRRELEAARKASEEADLARTELARALGKTAPTKETA
jgi:hypothetical protein